MTEGAPIKRRRRQLETLADVRRCLARACRGIETGRIEPRQGNALVYAYGTLAKLIAESAIEMRLAKLEEQMTPVKQAEAVQ